MPAQVSPPPNPISKSWSCHLIRLDVPKRYDPETGDTITIEPSSLPKQFFTGDFNGDGKDEALMVSYIYKGDPYNNIPFYKAHQSLCLFDLENDVVLYNRDLDVNAVAATDDESTLFLTNTPITPGDPPVLADANFNERLFVIDYDADLKTDVCWINNKKTSVFTFQNKASGMRLKQVNDYYDLNALKSDVDYNFFTGDFDGDGKTDLMKNGYVYRSTGMGTFTYSYIPDLSGKTNILAAQDMNNDGITDIVFYEETGDSITISTSYLQDGELYSESTGFSMEKNRVFIPGNPLKSQYNGSLLCLSGPYVRNISSVYDSERARLLTKVYDSYRNYTLIEYGRLTDTNKGIGGNLYQSDAYSAFPFCNYMGNATVVSSISTYSGNNRVAGTAFGYKNAVTHLQGLGFSGFEQISTYDLLIHQTSVQTFDPLRFGVVKSMDSPVEYSANSYSIAVAANKIASINLKQQVITDKLRGNTITTNITSHDSYGNALSLVNDYGNGITETHTNGYSYVDDSVSLRILPVSQTQTNTRDGVSASTSVAMSYNAIGLPTTKTAYYNNLLVSQETYSYDSLNRINASAKRNYNSDTLITLYERDIYGRLTKVTDPLGRSVAYTYNNNSLQKSVTDNKGNQTSFTYDSFGRKISEIRPDGTTSTVTLSWAANVGGALYLSSKTETGVPSVKIWQDALGREVRTSEKRFDGTELKTDKQYDPLGRLYKVSQPFKSTPILWNTYSYDNYDRPLKIEYASGKNDAWTYSGNSVTATIDNVSTAKTYNAKNELVSVVDPGGIIQYTLRPDGQCASISTAGITTSFGYDEYGRKTSLNDPSAGVETYGYDNSGNLNVLTNANGKTTSLLYNQFNQLVQKTCPEFATVYKYNADGLLESLTTDNQTSSSYIYDRLGRLNVLKTAVPDGRWLQKEFNYKSGKLVKTNYTFSSGSSPITEYYAYKNGTLYESGLEKEEQLVGPEEPGIASFSTSLSINPIPADELIGDQIEVSHVRTQFFLLKTESDLGLPTKSTTGVVSRDYGYDAYGRLISRKAYKGSNVFQNQSYSFGLQIANLNSRQNNKYGTAETFGYDAMQRLVAIDNEAGSCSTSYDSKGNITSHSQVGSFEYNLASKPYALTNATPLDNVMSLGEQAVAYTSFSRPATINENSYSAQFVYNGSADRVKMRLQEAASTTLTRYYIDNYEQEVAPAGPTERLYLGGDAYSAPAVLIKSGSGSWKIHYICRDYLGSITHIADSAGSVVQELDYDAWGRLRNPQTQEVYAPGEEPSLLLGRGYTGHEHLPQFGLINMNARLYDPALGRFLSPDPFVQDAENSQNYNRYSYVLNNPLRYTDPSGEKYTYDKLRGCYVDDNGNRVDWSDAYTSMFRDGIFRDGNSLAGGRYPTYLNEYASHADNETPQEKLDNYVELARMMGIDVSVGNARANYVWLQFSYVTEEVNVVAFKYYLSSDRETFHGSYFNIPNAIVSLNSNAEPNSTRYCARYIAFALEAGGLTTAGRPNAAKNYGPFLIKLGFNKVQVDNSMYKPGDIAVFEAFQGKTKYHQYGHIQMYNGEKWVSDFVQRDFWAGYDYRTYQPNYSIYRW